MESIEKKKGLALFYNKRPYEATKSLKLARDDIVHPDYVVQLDERNKGEYEMKVD